VQGGLYVITFLIIASALVNYCLDVLHSSSDAMITHFYNAVLCYDDGVKDIVVECIFHLIKVLTVTMK